MAKFWFPGPNDDNDFTHLKISHSIFDRSVCYFCGITAERYSDFAESIYQEIHTAYETLRSEEVSLSEETTEEIEAEIRNSFEGVDLSLKLKTVMSDPDRFPVPYWDQIDDLVEVNDRYGGSRVRTGKWKGFDVETISDVLPYLIESIIEDRQGRLLAENENKEEKISRAAKFEKGAKRLFMKPRKRFGTLIWGVHRQESNYSYRRLPRVRIPVPICPICEDRFQSEG